MEKIKLRTYIFYLIYLLFISNINCEDCSNCKVEGSLCKHTDEIRENCPSTCRLNLITKKCYTCENIGRGDYYQFGSDQTTCTVKPINCVKIIYNTFQCVDACPSGYFLLGDYCYQSCTGNMKKKSDSECKCIAKYYIEESSSYGKKLYICLSSNVACNPEHKSYDSETLECSPNPCDSSKRMKFEYRDDLSNIYQCKTACSSTEYYYKDGSNKYCIGECPKHKYYYYKTGGSEDSNVCVSECPGDYPYLYERQCLKEGDCDYIDGTKCLKSPSTCLHNNGTKTCVLYCDGEYPYKDEENNVCVKQCSSGFITPNNECVSSTTNCYYYDDESNDKICYSSCKESPYPFQIYDSKKCLSECSGTYKYQFENDKICYSSCAQVPFIGNYYYSDGSNICHCFLYGIKDGNYKCYDKEEDCITDGFKYKKGNQCLEECTTFIYKVPNNDLNKKLDECYPTVDECRDEKYFYYNTDDMRCYVSLPDNKYPNDKETITSLPQEDEGRNTYTSNCGSLRFPKKTTKGICKENCDNDEYFKPEAPNVCLTACDSDNPYIGYNNECLTSCPDYYIEQSGKKKCVQSCKDYGKYYFLGEHKCYDSCIKNNINYFYNLDDNKCVQTCMDNDDSNKYAYDNSDGPTPCLEKPEGKYYDINNIILTEECYLISLDDPQKCVDHCNGMKVYNKRCVSQCPDVEGPYVHVLRESSTNIYIDKCVLKCSDESGYNYIMIDRNECVKECPENYISDKDNRCFYAKCTKGLKYDISSHKCIDCSPYEIKKITTNTGTTKEIYICKSSCNGELKYIKDINDQECVAHCPVENNYIGDDYICRTHCNGLHSYYYEKYNNQKFYKCAKNCPTEDGYFYIVEYIENQRTEKEECVLSCPDTFPFAVENIYECLRSCPDDAPYYYKNERANDDKNYTCTSKFKCGYGSYKNKPYYCGGECCTAQEIIINKKKTYIENNQCVEQCSSNYKKKKVEYNDDYIIICKKNCDPNEYINGDECLEECPSDLNYIGKYNICRNGCKTQNSDPINYYPIESDADYQIYQCVDECPYNFLYSSRDNLCLESCVSPRAFFSKEENFCYNNCFLYSTNNKFSLSSGTFSECLSECSDPNYPTYQYYYENVKVCLEKCYNDDYAIEITNKCIRNCSSLGENYYSYENDDSQLQKKFCVTQCPSSKPYLRGKICDTSCDTNSETKFSIKEYKHGEVNLQKNCSTDCPSDYPYYYDDGKYECIEECETGHYFVPNFSSEKTAKLCLEECNYNSEDYKYKIENETSRTCYDECPSERPYHKNLEEETDNNCYDECPPDAPFHEKVADATRFICKTLEKCNNEYVDFETKECLADDETCSSTRKLSIYNNKKVCLNSCISPYGKYPTYYDTCVNDCANDELVSGLHLKKDPQNPQCICENLYYKMDDDTIVCFENSNNKQCKDMAHHKINLHGTKECILTCDGVGILSPLEDICFSDDYECSNYLHTTVYNKIYNENDEAKKKCDCIEKYYFDDNGEKICLDSGEICPKGYDQKYIPEKMQCLKDGNDCPEPYTHLFLDKYCLRICPGNSTETDNKCYCKNPYNYWREVSHSNFECIKDCYDIHLVSIPSDSNKCVEKCSGHYSRYYNNECYSTCDETIDTNIKIKNAIEVYDEEFDLSRYKCECKTGDSWYIDEDTNIKYCVDDCFSITPSFKYVIKGTSQCVNTCPQEYYIFNNECFTSCEDEAYSKYHLNVKSVSPFHDCQCRGLWQYIDEENTVKECLMEETCAQLNSEKKFLFNDTQCLEECPEGWLGFNYVCSNNCPQKTIDKKSENGEFDCSCNLNDGLWYEYQEYGNTYYTCGLEKCPKYHITSDNNIFVRSNLIESEKKCVNSCRKEGSSKNKNFYALRNICIENCPNYTYVNKDNDACLFFDLNDTRITYLELLKNAANVQVKELYESAEKTGGFLFNKFNASLEIYSINSSNTLKNISFKSNLTYIDFGPCLDKLYSDKSLGDKNTILVAKYDLLPGANINIDKEVSENKNYDKYLINPVEYELFSSNMSEKIDAHVCDPYEILISYPLVFSKFDKVIDGITQNEYRKKFQMGKDLYHLDNEIDTFNYNNTIYKNFCKGLEIEGKDLVYEDRYKYLYPNNKILCESNCTLNNTDFELERVNCLCTYKNILYLNRTEKQTNDILNDPNFILPTQSSSNIEVLGCLFKFNLKQTILYNDAFYYCSVGIIVQIVMLILSACSGIKNASLDIKHLLNKINLKKNNFGPKVKAKRNMAFKNENIINSTNRPLNAPPKKNIINDEEHDDNDIDSSEKEKGTSNIISDNNSSNNGKENKVDNRNKIINDNNDMKVEYIPPDYNFKFFKENDKSVMKKVERSTIPFEINPDTKYLIERREGIEYPEDYLEGPYYQDQNILILTDEQNKDADKIEKYIKNEKLSKKLKPINKNNDKKNNDDDKKNNDEDKKNNDDDKKNNDDDKLEKKMKKRTNILGTEKNNYKIDEKSSFDFKKQNQSIQRSKTDYSNETLFEILYDYSNLKLDKDEMNLFSLVKREQLFLRVDYQDYIEKDHGNILSLFLAEILDKIYFVKICLFLKKVDIFSIHCCLYILCHIVLLSLLCGFFTIKVIKKIWEEENFPGLNFYLLYGLISHLIVWVVYQIFLCILDSGDKVKDLIILKSEIKQKDLDNIDIDDKDDDILQKKYNDLTFQIKVKAALFYIISLLLSLFLTIYLIAFFSLYTGTKRRVLKAYYISIIEILLIKFVYGVILSSLRLLSTKFKIILLYNIVRIFNKYIS